MISFLIQLTKDLIACPSVTPEEAGSFNVLEKILVPLGFKVEKFQTQGVTNFYARYGTESPHLTFVGHVDVVPPGPGWNQEPFTPTIKEDILYGRGAVDMKGAIAAFVESVKIYLEGTHNFSGSLSFLLTSDEEGPGQYGIKSMVPWLKKTSQVPDFFLIGEPTSETKVGDTFKTGRRGSVNTLLTVKGQQGHVAYPESTLNPCPPLLKILKALTDRDLDKGYENFPPSNLEVVGLETSTQVTNMVPESAKAHINIRFNPHHTGKQLSQWIEDVCQQHTKDYDTQYHFSAEPFQSQTSPFHQSLHEALEEVCDAPPKNAPTGGTSDGRFLHTLAPLAELGLLNATAHQANEHLQLADLEKLSQAYLAFFNRFF
ncbi:MAG: succinyl-diaminopimelate desuccinylase [bacterium]|nr:succinyl-diaminopimelate desuccinylase [bacterium]